MNIRTLYEAVFIRQLPQKAADTHKTDTQHHFVKKEKKKNDGTTQAQQLENQQKKDAALFTKTCRTMSDAQKTQFQTLLHQYNPSLETLLTSHFPPVKDDTDVLSQPLSEVIESLGLSVEQCRVIDRELGEKIFYLNYLFIPMLKNDQYCTLLLTLIEQYNPDLRQMLIESNHIVANIDVKTDEYTCIKTLQLTDEQITTIEKITNIQKSQIKSKMNFMSIMCDPARKNTFRMILHKHHPELEISLFGSNTASAGEQEALYPLPHSDEIKTLFLELNKFYGYFTGDQNLDLYISCYYASKLYIDYIEKDYTKTEPHKTYSPEMIAVISYKMLVVFSNDKKNTPRDVLNNVDLYMKNHNFKNSTLFDVFNFILPSSKSINYDEIVVINENDTPPIANAKKTLFIQLSKNNELRVFWNQNDTQQNKTIDLTKEDATDLLNQLALTSGRSSDKHLIQRIVEQFSCHQTILSSQILSSSRKLIEQKGEKATKLLNEISLIEYYINQEKRIDLLESYVSGKIKADIFLNHIYEILAIDGYGLTFKEDKMLAMLFIKENKSADQFKFALHIKALRKKTDNLPNVIINCNETSIDRRLHHPGYYLVKLPIDDDNALLLGDITKCCQRIGGHAEQCVIDGITQANNGFYVFLKAVDTKSINTPPLIEGKINYNHYKIVAQYYAWKSAGGNLVIDSLESLKDEKEKSDRDSRWKTPLIDRIAIDVLPIFAAEATKIDPTIVSVNIGTGGETPFYFSGIREIAVISEYEDGEITQTFLKEHLTEHPIFVKKHHKNNEIILYLLSEDGAITSIPLTASHEIKSSPKGERLSQDTSMLSDGFCDEIRIKTNSDFKKATPLSPREIMIDSYQYGDSIKQVSLYVNHHNQDHERLLKNNCQKLLENSYELTLGQDKLLKVIPLINSITVLTQINELLQSDKNDLLWTTSPYDQLFNNVAADNETVISLFYAIAFLNEKHLFNENSAFALVCDVEGNDPLNPNIFINRALVYVDIVQMTDSSTAQQSMIDILHHIDSQDTKYLVRIFQAMKYAKSPSPNGYSLTNLLNESTLSFVMELTYFLITNIRHSIFIVLA